MDICLDGGSQVKVGVEGSSVRLYPGVSVAFAIANYCCVNSLGPIECLAVSNTVRGSIVAQSFGAESSAICEVRGKSD